MPVCRRHNPAHFRLGALSEIEDRSREGEFRKCVVGEVSEGLAKRVKLPDLGSLYTDTIVI